MPHDFPPWQTVYDHFSQWNKSGTWEAALDEINGIFREKKKRSSGPTFGIVDAQSVKTQFASEEIGFDGGKKVKGHKRHIVVDINFCQTASEPVQHPVRRQNARGLKK